MGPVNVGSFGQSDQPPSSLTRKQSAILASREQFGDLSPSVRTGKNGPKCDRQKGFHQHCAIDLSLSPSVYRRIRGRNPRFWLSDGSLALDLFGWS